ncbi:hypothetical protein, partial [Porphyromonas gingivalis]|uniref:hypothetical protein n=1 Tax=Porphyromonas gingivalis TaxID=837 RepID=UPI001E5AA36B
MGAKVKPFSEPAKSNGSFFRADVQEKARRLILPPKNTDALGGTIPLSIGQESLLRSQKYAFFLYRQIFQNLFSTGSTKNSPRRKGLPPKKEDKRERIISIYNMFARVRETQKERKRNRMRRCFFPREKSFFDRNVGGWSGIKG